MQKPEKNTYALFDADAKLYIKLPLGYEIPAQAGKPGNAFATSSLEAKSWKKLHWAIIAGRKCNEERHAKGGKNSKKRSEDRPHVEIHEIDAGGNCVMVLEISPRSFT